ncbi:hypothetical protein VTO73DRAFT_8251 [Trametes versicolor]
MITHTHKLAASHCVCWVPHAETVRSPLLPDAFAALAHWLCCTSHERVVALLRSLNDELPVTWNEPSAFAVTVGGVTPPSAPVNFWRLPAVDAAAAEVAAAAAAEVDVAAALVAAAVVAAAADVAAAAEPEPVPAMALPWSSTAVTAAKSVWIPKTALNASAWPPVLAVTVSAAERAVWQVALAVASAPQLFVRVSQMNW